MKRLRPGGVIAQARQRVSLVSVLRELGVDIDAPPVEGRNRRVHCPFGSLNHEDTGIKAEMRVYNDTESYCHACAAQYDPVNLMAMVWGCSNNRAARRLLARLEAVEGPDVAADSSTAALSRAKAGMVAALGVWADSVGVDRTSPGYAAVLAELDWCADVDAAERWLAAAKQDLMAR